MTAPFLSIIIPAHNEEGRLPAALNQVFAFLKDQAYPAEVVVVENGSTDRTFELACSYQASHPNLRVFQENERGKGRAVRRGMLEACGEYRFMCDADLSMPVDQIALFLPPVLADFDVAIGSREAPGSIRYNEPEYRHLGGRAVNLMIRLLALPGLNDTQCGFKCFRAQVAKDLFQQQTLTGWSFDIELLYIARRRAYRIVEVPISWYFNSESKLNAFQDALIMGLDILKMHLNALIGRYGPRV
ncbi:MAG TPA: dolichyl-phosphate beta-glucosyltransferase [Anaerolineales bacterium]|nr:dolichyl-phosphate beta-glucosyltransferase [Anaerolineales bacterium]